MEEIFRRLAEAIAVGVEAGGALLIAIGATEALIRTLWPTGHGRPTLVEQKTIWVGFARWLVLALEFQLAADVVRTAISPSWDDIGQLGAIAGIRTFLNFFLERDMKEIGDSTR